MFDPNGPSRVLPAVSMVLARAHPAPAGERNQTVKITHHPSSGLAGKASELGASLVEYALLVALIAVVCIGGVAFLGKNSSSTVSKGATGISNVSTTTAPAGCPSVHPDGYA